MCALKECVYVAQNENKEYMLTYKMFMIAGKIMERDRFIEEMLPYLDYFSMTTDCGMSLTSFTDDVCINLISVSKALKAGRSAL